MELGTLSYRDLLELRMAVDQEIKHRQDSQDPVSFRCPECGLENDKYLLVHNHMMGEHGYGYKRTINEIVRLYP